MGTPGPSLTDLVVRVLPDEPGIDKEFDYLVPRELGALVRVGTRVRVELHGRRIGAWVVALDVQPPAGVDLRAVAKVTGWGPPEEVIDLAGWAAWRWAGRRASFLRTASPPRAVTDLRRPGRAGHPLPGPPDELVAEAFTGLRSVLRLPPAADLYPVALAAAARGNALVVAPSEREARLLATRLRRAGAPIALVPEQWARAAAGATVVGTRAAAWAPVADLAAAVVVDEHDEGHRQEQAPTWHARDVVAERAERAGAPCVLVSPVPTLEAQDWGRLVTPSRSAERAGWAVLDVIDRRQEPPAAGLYSERLVPFLRGEGRVVCVLNRTGRARLLVCAACGATARCERCDAAVVQDREGALVCTRCETTRPVVCQACGGGRLKTLRLGVTRAAEDLAALVREPVAEVWAGSEGEPQERVVVGTEAALHRVPSADVVAFLDVDQELLAPRYRAPEQALALLARAARLVGGRHRGGRVVVQTRSPDHEVLAAALHADPGRLVKAERSRRAELGFPPATALAVVSGASAEAYVEALGRPLGLEVLGPRDGAWLLRAPDHRTLCDALAATPRPGGRLRIEVDPVRT